MIHKNKSQIYYYEHAYYIQNVEQKYSILICLIDAIHEQDIMILMNNLKRLSVEKKKMSYLILIIN